MHLFSIIGSLVCIVLIALVYRDGIKKVQESKNATVSK